jgi:hypothetical protein
MVEESNNNWWTGELEQPFGRGINFQIEVSDVSVLVERLEESDIALFRPIDESWYRVGDFEIGKIAFLVQDPDGYLLRFTQDIGERKLLK